MENTQSKIFPTDDDFEDEDFEPPSNEYLKGQVLGQRDSELLLSFLTTPYIRLSLVLTFFSSDDRVSIVLILLCMFLRKSTAGLCVASAAATTTAAAAAPFFFGIV